MNDARLEAMIGSLLRAGVLLAAAIVLAGGTLYLRQHGTAQVSYSVFRPGGAQIRTLSGITNSAAHLQSEGLIQFGLLLLIATPVARVVLALVGFALERDRLYTVISLVVLAILGWSLMAAR